MSHRFFGFGVECRYMLSGRFEFDRWDLAWGEALVKVPWMRISLKTGWGSAQVI